MHLRQPTAGTERPYTVFHFYIEQIYAYIYMMPQMKMEIDTYLSHPYIQVRIPSRHIYMYMYVCTVCAYHDMIVI